jgi:prepilin-type N-terminal cleavage/methylation domain-containing protein
MRRMEGSAGQALRRRHRSQRGLTLIEILIATSITGIIALGLGAALSLGVRLTGPGGVTGQQVASNTVLSVEHLLSTDVSHAECVTTSPNPLCPLIIPSGPRISVPSVCTPGFLLCVAWCQSGSLQGARYSLAGGQLVRKDASTSIVVGRNTQVPTLTASGGAAGPSWLTIGIVAGSGRPQQANFTVRSVITGAASCASGD